MVVWVTKKNEKEGWMERESRESAVFTISLRSHENLFYRERDTRKLTRINDRERQRDCVCL
jgi:hypothetical protein